MIRYIELTPNADIPFQSGRIISTLVDEGDNIEIGDVLFIVNAQGKEAEVLANKAGKINELIVATDDVIHKLSSLLVLETIVADKPAEANVTENTEVGEAAENSAVTIQQTEEITDKESPVQTAAVTTSPINPETDKKVAKPDQEKSKFAKKPAYKNNKPILQNIEENQASLNFEQLETNASSQSKNTQEEKTIMNEIKVPDLGGADAVEVIDILVNVGDKISPDDALMTVESDKASMDIPSSTAGTIEEIVVVIGDNISEGDVIFKVSGANSQESVDKHDDSSAENLPESKKSEEVIVETQDNSATKPVDTKKDIFIPDLGGASDVEVIDVLVAVGDSVEADQAVITVESDKASMDVPSSHAGIIESITITVGDIVNEGDVILVMTSESATANTESTPKLSKQESTEKTKHLADVQTPKPSQTESVRSAESSSQPSQAATTPSGPSHASPSVRRLARELGVDLGRVVGTSRKQRISKADVKNFVKSALASGSTQHTQSTAFNNSGIPEVPAQDFSKFGDIELQPLNKIKRITAQHLHRAWLNIPHVTHNDETNIQSLEEFRKTLNAEYAKKDKGIKLSPLAFIVKAVVNALQNFPQFNSSLENGGNNLILKKYYHIGIAVETPNGLMVPVIRDADKLSVADIALAMGDLAKKARDGKLTPKEMQGGTFSISSLGGIGGTSFTPIVNAPEVAILGVSRTKIQPLWNGSEFIPAPMLPLSLSYDHRVIDGAEAARFTRHIAVALEDIRRLTV